MTLDDRPFVARTQELDELLESLEDSLKGRPQSVLVAGEAGVGKSRLVGRFLELAENRGAWSMYGACFDQSGEGLPFGPIREALRSFLRGRAQDQIEAVPETIRDGLAGLLPDSAPTSGPTKNVTHPPNQQRVLESLLDLMEWASGTRPLVAVFEDLHWADPSSLACLSYLNSNLNSQRVLMVSTYRTDEISRRHRLLGWIGEQRRKKPVGRLEVKPFGPPETEEMIVGILRAPLAEGIASRVYERSEGNAFFVEELVAAWADGVETMPSSLREVLLARVGNLSDETQTVLRVAAIGGRVLSPDLLSKVLRRMGEDPTQSLREAIDRHVISFEPDGAFTFRHALLHELFTSEVLPGEKERIHAAYAQVLEASVVGDDQDPTTMAQVAHHWYHARDTERALLFSVRAGDAAMTVGAFDVAQARFETAVSLMGGNANLQASSGLSYAELLGRASRAAHLAGKDDRAIALVKTAIAHAKELKESSEEGLLYGMLGWYEFCREPSRAAFEAYEQALELIPPSPPTPARARALAEYARLWMLWGANDKAKPLAEDAFAVARSVGALREEALALDPLGITLAMLGETDKGLDYLRRAISLARQVGDFEEELRSYMNLGEVFFRSDDLEEATSTWLEGADRARQTGMRKRGGSFLLCNVCQAQFESGDWDGMEQTLREAKGWLAPRGWVESFWLTLAGRLALCRGEFDAAHRYLQESAAMAGGETDLDSTPEFVGDLYRSLVDLAVWEERYDDSRELGEAGLTKLANTDELRRWGGLVLAAALRGEADRAQGLVRPTETDIAAAHERGVALVELVRKGGWDALSESSGLTGAVAATCRAELQRLGRKSNPAAWAEAAAAWAKCGRPYEEAYARWRQAEALAPTRNKSAANEALTAAHNIAQKLKARPLLHELKMLARRARLEPEGTLPAEKESAEESSAEDRVGLTEREKEVLQHIALGRTNREIGDALFISPKTAGVHVSHILEKLGVRSRVAAAGMAHKLGLLDE